MMPTWLQPRAIYLLPKKLSMKLLPTTEKSSIRLVSPILTLLEPPTVISKKVIFVLTLQITVIGLDFMFQLAAK